VKDQRNRAINSVSIRASLQQRGERHSAGKRHVSLCFNPRLTSAARRTPQVASPFSPVCRFQSAPHFSSEANIVAALK